MYPVPTLFSFSYDVIYLDFKSNLHPNETINKVANIAKKAGVINSLDEIERLHTNAAAGGKLGVKLQVDIVFLTCRGHFFF